MPIRIKRIPIRIEQAAGTPGGSWRVLWQGTIASGVSHLAGGLLLGSVWGTAIVQLVQPPAGPNAIQHTASQIVMLGATMDDVADQPTPVTTLGIDASDQTTSNILQAQRPLPPDIGKMPPAWSIVDQIRPMETALVRGLEQATPNLESAPLRKSFDAAQHLVEPVATPLLKKSVVAPPVTSDTVAAPAEPSIVQQGQDVESPPQKVYSPAPTYPASALREGLTGRVVLRVHLDADGKVVSARVRRSSGHTVLDEAALASVRRWRFQPARRLGVAVEQVIAVPITFRIERRP